jgi:predicted site-specific integrase-resolvase
MNERLYTPKELSDIIGVTTQTLLQWEQAGKIKADKTKGGHRRYWYREIPSNDGVVSKKQFIYARVSSAKQKNDLQRQIDALQAIYPTYTVIQDIGSGINFKRRGLLSLLDDVFGGHVSKIVVAHRDRLSRFGFELFEHIFKRFGATVEVVSDSDVKEPTVELAKDLLSIITVFSARYYGSRSYNALQENTVLPKQRTNITTQQMHRGIKVLLQSSGSTIKRPRSRRFVALSNIAATGNEER